LPPEELRRLVRPALIQTSTPSAARWGAPGPLEAYDDAAGEEVCRATVEGKQVGRQTAPSSEDDAEVLLDAPLGSKVR
jgi:hypothetical protein